MSKSKPTWRDGMIAAAADARARMKNATAVTSADAFNRGAAYAFGVLADEFAYVASLSPHEGLERMREMGSKASRAWATAFAEHGSECSARSAEDTVVSEHMLQINAAAEARERSKSEALVELNEYEKACLRDSEIIEAIKALRARVPGLSLMEAKRSVDAYRNTRSKS